MKRLNVAVALSLAAAIAAACLWAAQAGANKPPQLAEDLPSGALMTLESPDFARLLHDWSNSPEHRAWMKGASFSAFTNSHLWERLTSAEEEFAGVADADFDSEFLQSVAGTQSIFAWYDIGNLEFLYITRLKPGQAAGVPLLVQRGKFRERKAGEAVFYIRRTAADQASGSGQERTVAFAQRGEYLLLATREDLIANALLRMQGHKDVQGITEEGWYEAASKSASGPPGELHMLLDLQSISKTPQFQSYWIQRNVTDTRRFRAAVVDLYRERDRFREERTLLPLAAGMLPPGSADATALQQLVPQRAGVYRIIATPSMSDALTEMRDKVLERVPVQRTSSYIAPDADLSVPEAGDAHDLETRIDAPQAAQEPEDAWLYPLRDTLAANPLTAMMTVSRTDLPASAALFFPIHSAVVLRRSEDWDSAQLSAAILTALRRRLTVSNVGLEWKTEKAGGATYFISTGAQRIALSVHGNTAILSTDPALLREILARTPSPTSPTQAVIAIAEFRHAHEQAAFLRLSAVLDGAQSAPQDSITSIPAPIAPSQPASGPQTHSPTFFHDNLGSLSRAFSTMDTEHFTERRDGTNLRQTVYYTWTAPFTEH